MEVKVNPIFLQRQVEPAKKAQAEIRKTSTQTTGCSFHFMLAFGIVFLIFQEVLQSSKHQTIH